MATTRNQPGSNQPGNNTPPKAPPSGSGNKQGSGNTKR